MRHLKDANLPGQDNKNYPTMTRPRPLAATNRFVHRVVAASTIACAALFVLSAVGQEASVRPGINKAFEGDDTPVERYRKIFEAESREIFQHRYAIVAVMQLEPGMQVADIGAGTGLFTRLISDAVGDDGRVFAIDISRGFLNHIQQQADEQGRTNIVTVLGGAREAKLEPESVDRVFICDTYHHFEYPQDMLASIHSALRPDGELYVVDFERVEGVTKAWVLGHVRCGKGTVTDEIKDAGFEFVSEIPLMREQYVLKFRKRSVE